MVLLRTVPSSFHARVLAARLGADGIPTQLRGGLDGPYPMGDVMVFVTQDDLDVARELLLADEVEAAFDEAEDVDHRPRIPPWIALSLLLLVVLGGLVILR
jgi:hypothetical protein